MKRKPICIVTLGICALPFVTSPLRARNSIVLSPVQVIDLSACVGGQRPPGFRINDFQVTQNAIYVIAATGKTSSPILGKFDIRGNCVASTPLPTLRGDRLAVDSRGTLVVNANATTQGGRRQKLLFYNGADLAPQDSLVLSTSIWPFAVAGGSVYGVRRSDHQLVRLIHSPPSSSGALSLETTPIFSHAAPLAPLQAYLLTAVNDTSLVLFEEGPRRLTRIDLATGTASSLVVDGPEMNRVLEGIPASYRPATLDPANPNARVLARTVIAMGASTQTVYLELSRFDPRQGPTLLAIDTANSKQQAINCRPPVGRLFTPSAQEIGVDGSTLYLVDASTGLMVSYNSNAILQ